MRVLVACEFSGLVRQAFIARGHDAVSCDLLPTELPGAHITGDVLEHLGDGWDLMIGFPPCTHLSVSGACWFPEKRADGRQQAGIDFFIRLADAPIPKVAIENPVGIMSTLYGKPSQTFQPWQFGHGEVKRTCLWLRGLPLLVPTHADGDLFCPATPKERVDRVHRMAPGPNRWKERSRTFNGVALAMAAQWGGVL